MPAYDYQQTSNATSGAYPCTATDDIKIPLLSPDDIIKLDQLLLFMKQKRATANNVFGFCKEGWGDNKLLYLYFAEYLKINFFTSVQNNTNGIEYAWMQTITQRGLALDSFKKEYDRQYRNKTVTVKPQEQLEDRTNFTYNAFLIATLTISLSCGTYFFYDGIMEELGKAFKELMVINVK